MKRSLRKWYVTFKPKNKSKWVRFSNRFYVISATSLDQAMKQAIDLFGKDWLNVKEESEKPDLTNLTEVEYDEIKKEIERQSRIPFKTFREKEADAKKS